MDHCQERRHVPLKLADAERIASGLHVPVSLAGRIAHGVRPNLDLDWPSMMSDERPQSAPDADILDLPEPIEDRYVPVLSRPAVSPTPRGDHFDYSTWSHELNDLLQRPMMSPVQARSAGDLGSSQERLSDAGSKKTYVASSRDDAKSLQGPRRRSTWMPIIVLCLAGAVMGGIIGGAAYGLASPEIVSWVTGAGDLLGRLQIAVSR
jgi:hypothetical protein